MRIIGGDLFQIYVSLFISILTVLMSSCEKEDKSSSSIELSEKIYNADFAINEIEEITIFESNQRTLYPVPKEIEWNSGLSIKNNEFFYDFHSSLQKSPFEKIDYDPKDYDAIHILVKLYGYDKYAYLHGTTGRDSFYLAPKFKGDSYGGANNHLFLLLQNTLEKKRNHAPTSSESRANAIEGGQMRR